MVRVEGAGQVAEGMPRAAGPERKVNIIPCYIPIR